MTNSTGSDCTADKKELMLEFTIPGRLPGINEYTNACRRNPYSGARMKKEGEQVCSWAVITAMRNWGPFPIDGPVRLEYTYYEPNEKRDVDNISGFAHKVIQDILVTLDVLKDDSMKFIKGYSDEFYIDRENPRIEVKIMRAGACTILRTEPSKKKSGHIKPAAKKKGAAS